MCCCSAILCYFISSPTGMTALYSWFLRSWKVIESHGVLASHGKSWKMERVMEKSWNFNHLFSEKILELQK